MVHRTKTYIAADWDNDFDAVERLHKWNDNPFYSKLDFVDVHEFVQARDTSLYCTIKRSLNERMDMSKTFILIVGSKTNSVTKGGCQYCERYVNLPWRPYCQSGNSVNYKSYIEHECELAIKNELYIVVLYNSNYVYKELCPKVIRDIGVHTAMKENGTYSYWKVRDAILKAENSKSYWR